MHEPTTHTPSAALGCAVITASLLLFWAAVITAVWANIH